MTKQHTSYKVKAIEERAHLVSKQSRHRHPSLSSTSSGLRAKVARGGKFGGLSGLLLSGSSTVSAISYLVVSSVNITTGAARETKTANEEMQQSIII